MPKKKLFFIVGPTAIGKTEIAFWLAKKFKTEIISCDAMQVYKEISILSGKPPQKFLKSIKHHLIDVISINKNFDVFIFRKMVLSAIKAIERKNKIPIIVGGSGLYMSILLDGIFEGGQQAKNLDVRKRIEQRIKENGKEAVYEYLKKVDPTSASKIHINDTKRVVRCLEVFETYGKPISAFHQKREGLWSKYDISIFMLDRVREDLYRRIDTRVDQMINAGALKEIKGIRRKKMSQTARSIIGVKEFLAFLNGDYDLEKTKYFIKRNTRHFAKRQLTWFRKDKRLTWITVDKEATTKEIGSKILDFLKKD